MIKKYGFTQFSLPEFEKWLKNLQVTRNIRTIQQHHTWAPSYKSCTSKNQLELTRNMKHFHVAERGWSDIGQHFSTYPDGSIVTGRSMEKSPACIYGNNSGSICIEHVGNFDKNKDAMTEEHTRTIVGMTAALCKRFNIVPSTDHIVYHHWFNLKTGARNNGKGFNKSCPGTAFFGGNSVASAEANFIPMVEMVMKGKTGKPNKALQFYAKINTETLNVRKASSARSAKVGVVFLGAIVRVYEEEKGWYKISKSNDEWISGRYADVVKYGTITASVLNVRSGPNKDFPVVEKILKGQEVVVEAEKDGWSKISISNKWVSSKYVEMLD